MRNGDILHNPWTDSHEDLIRLFKLRDNRMDNFARVEFKPDDPNELATPEKYKLHIDEQRCPDWFDEDMKVKVSEKMRGWIKSRIIDGDADIICGGVFILAKGARITTVKNARIVVMLGSSNVGEMWESSNVGEMRGSSNVGAMRGSSNVGAMLESSNVGAMLESSNVGAMRGSSKVGAMRGSSKVGAMWESSNVGEMRGSSNVGEMWESSNVGAMLESSKVINDQREK
jgi:hypothetical protein